MELVFKIQAVPVLLGGPQSATRETYRVQPVKSLTDLPQPIRGLVISAIHVPINVKWVSNNATFNYFAGFSQWQNLSTII